MQGVDYCVMYSVMCYCCCVQGGGLLLLRLQQQQHVGQQVPGLDTPQAVAFLLPHPVLLLVSQKRNKYIRRNVHQSKEEERLVHHSSYA